MCDRVFPFIYLINIFILKDANVSEFKFEYIPLRERVRQSKHGDIDEENSK